jgi:hypothetical protein
MTSPNDSSWAPSPELLAGYFDGEFEGRDDLAPLRQRLENWLVANPGGRAELAEHRRLRHLWLETMPTDPAPAAWHGVLCRLKRSLATRRPAPRHARQPMPWKWAYLAGAACVLVAFFLSKELAQAPEDNEPFPVASEREVVILRVEGADTGTLVVGELPLQGPLVLVGPGDVTLTSIEPAQRDNMVPEVNVTGPGRPIIWTRAAAEED